MARKKGLCETISDLVEKHFERIMIALLLPLLLIALFAVYNIASLSF